MQNQIGKQFVWVKYNGDEEIPFTVDMNLVKGSTYGLRPKNKTHVYVVNTEGRFSILSTEIADSIIDKSETIGIKPFSSMVTSASTAKPEKFVFHGSEPVTFADNDGNKVELLSSKPYSVRDNGTTATLIIESKSVVIPSKSLDYLMGNSLMVKANSIVDEDYVRKHNMQWRVYMGKDITASFNKGNKSLHLKTGHTFALAHDKFTKTFKLYHPLHPSHLFTIKGNLSKTIVENSDLNRIG